MEMMKFSFVFALAVLVLAGCKKKDDEEPAPPAPPVVHDEVFTTVRLNLTNTEPIGGVYEQFTFTYRDLDGPGGQPPVVEMEPLPVGAYSVSITLYNESVSPAVNLTQQVQANATSRQFFFATEGVLALSVFDRDLDANGLPFGMNLYVSAMMASEGTFKVTLVNDPDKNAEGVAQGDITNAGGQIAFEVEFPMEITQ
jgi:hypothetical protein